jgi:hypothetical protein
MDSSHSCSLTNIASSQELVNHLNQRNLIPFEPDTIKMSNNMRYVSVIIWIALVVLSDFFQGLG